LARPKISVLGLLWRSPTLQSKTGQYKTIPLTSRVFEIVKNKIKIKHLHHRAHNLVFPSENGAKITASNLGRAFRKALKKAGIEGFRFHDLRHTFASRCAQGGVDLYIIQKYLGHKEPKMVQRYSHHSIESLRGGIEVLEKQNQQSQENQLPSGTILAQSGGSIKDV
jgi:integrase